MSGDPVTRQGRRARGALLRAARTVLETRGYHGTRITDITAEAGMSVGSFYTYFDSKETIFRTALIEVEDEVYGELAASGREPANPAERIRTTNALYLEAFQRNRAFWRAVEEAALTNEDARRVLQQRRRYYRGRTRRALARWQDGGVISADLDLDVAATALGAMTERCAYLWFIFGYPADTDAADQLTRLWLHVLGMTPDGSAARQ